MTQQKENNSYRTYRIFPSPLIQFLLLYESRGINTTERCDQFKADMSHNWPELSFKLVS